MASMKIFFSILISLLAFAACASAASFTVGDATGWTIPPATSFYNTWAAGKKFAVNDKLVFNFQTGLHNAMRVSKAEYDACTATSALESYTTGPATVTLNVTGTYYFICSVGAHCNFGQKVAVTVGSTPAAPTTSPSPSPSTTPSPPAPPTLAPGPSGISPSPSSSAGSPSNSPNGSPSPSPTAGGSSAVPSPKPSAGYRVSSSLGLASLFAVAVSVVFYRW